MEAAVSDTDIEIFYLVHRQRLRRPERRQLRHILITIDEDSVENRRPEVAARVAAIHSALIEAPQSFAEQALKYSECPTALNDGLLGRVSRGQLYPELEAVAFALAPGELSAPVESPLGLHLLRCDGIEEAQALSLAETTPAIRRHLEKLRLRSGD